MKIITLSVVWLAAVLPAAAATTGLIPEVQSVTGTGAPPFRVSENDVIFAPKEASPLVRRGVEMFREEYRGRFGRSPEVRFQLDRGLIWGESPDLELPALPGGFDAYAIRVAPRGVVLDGAGDAGIFYGLQTLRQLLDPSGTVPGCVIRDWSDQEWRPVYCYPFYDPEALLAKLARLKINMVIVESNWDFSGNWWFNPAGANLDAARRFIELAEALNIEVVPLVQGGGWAYGFIDQDPACAESLWVPETSLTLGGELTDLPYPNLVVTEAKPFRVAGYREEIDYELVRGSLARPFAEEAEPWRLRILPGGGLAPGMTVSIECDYMTYSPHQTPYCPLEPATRAIVRRTLEEVIRIYRPRFLHIGHDEVIYRNRCRLCRNSGRSDAELAGEDIALWCGIIAELAPETRIMIWDDLLRPDRDRGEVLRYLPEEVIICPWNYEAKETDRQSIARNLEWFALQNRRPVFGVSSGYYHENVLLWNQELAPYRAMAAKPGLMFSLWGDSAAQWRVVAVAADLMWSHARPSAGEMSRIVAADYRLNGALGWCAQLEFEFQQEAVAAAQARDDDEVRRILDNIAAPVLADRLEAFRDRDNPFPEAIVSQPRRLDQQRRKYQDNQHAEL